MAANIPAVRLTLDDGTDLTDRVNPRLLDLTLTEKSGEEADTLEVTIHNHDRALAPPRKGAVLDLALGWKSGPDVTPGLVSKGRFIVDESRRAGPPDRVTLRARAADFAGDFKRRRDQMWRDTTLGAILSAIAGRNGLTPRIDPALARTAIATLEQRAKSDMTFVRDLGRRFDAIAAPKGGALVFMPVGATTTATGKPLPQITLTRRDGWAWEFGAADRDDYDGAKASYRDLDGGRNRTVEMGGDKKKRLKRVYATEADARAAAAGEITKRKRGAFEFTYDLDLGDPALAPGTAIRLDGWDSEIDAISWLIAEATHRLGSSGLATAVRLESK